MIYPDHHLIKNNNWSFIRYYSRKSGKTIYKVIIAVILLSLSLSLTMRAQNTADPPLWTGNPNSKIIRDYNDMLKSIHSVPDDNIKIIKAGSVYYDNIEYPVYAFSYTPAEKPAVRIFLAAGQHGNEPASAEAVIDFFTYIHRNKESYRDIAIDAIPMINPWGWVYNIRLNGNKQDTNRDFMRFNSQEARVVRDFVKGKSYDFMIDHHESPGDGAFIFNYNEATFNICNNLMNFLKSEGYGIGIRGYFKDRILINGIMDVPSRRGLRSLEHNNSVSSYWNKNSTIVRYFSSELNTYGFTMETSTRKLFKYRIECHFDVMRFMVDAFRRG
ncbi:MAG: hypothetical protein JXB88_20310 [Spirochaetales bacterium]|nr:hypothetical protein [Spirochaetales bacterium]